VCRRAGCLYGIADKGKLAANFDHVVLDCLDLNQHSGYR
jgi:hypothetical protein